MERGIQCAARQWPAMIQWNAVGSSFARNRSVLNSGDTSEQKSFATSPAHKTYVGQRARANNRINWGRFTFTTINSFGRCEEAFLISRSVSRSAEWKRRSEEAKISAIKPFYTDFQFGGFLLSLGNEYRFISVGWMSRREAPAAAKRASQALLVLRPEKEGNAHK